MKLEIRYNRFTILAPKGIPMHSHYNEDVQPKKGIIVQECESQSYHHRPDYVHT
jgi:hypothetical protein